ncbi:protein takeout [Eupeodes corollae]|uniref:protein takeout n=1 Tax=Eupeodes corollae TaxID=290404 RepID=UPI0024915321|nr:protein takeout [Eupeodes corollae]XP_055903735.1 protein takeout [Eupeodes corollae]
MAYRQFLVLVLLLVVFDVYLAQSPKIPDYIHICHRNDPKINECIRNTVHEMRPYLGDGIKELNVPPLEPLYIGDLNILDGGRNGFTVKTKNLNIYGAANFEIKKLNALDQGRHIDFEMVLPRLHGEGTYDVSGQLLALPLKGNGRFSGNFTNFNAFVKLDFEVKTDSENVDRVGIKNLEVKIIMGKGRIRLYNLFNGDKTLGDIINETINQNFETFTMELIPPIERALEKKFLSIAGKIMETFTYDELFPV